jgi:ribonuclease III
MAQPVGGSSGTLKERLGLQCADTPLLEVALTHRSYSFERPDVPNYERLEFLGDAVLGLVVTDMIFHWFPDLPEGELAKLRSSAVNTVVLANIARSIGLGDDLLLGRGEEHSGGRNKDSILADSLEAVLGAAYVDCGLEQIRAVVERLFSAHIRAEFDRGVLRDFKTNLQEVAVQHGGALPEYRISSTGPDHDRSFEAQVYIRGEYKGSGVGRSKKLAEQAAAQQALIRLAEEAGPAPAPAPEALPEPTPEAAPQPMPAADARAT